jgi:nicotinamidase-related amidase
VSRSEIPAQPFPLSVDFARAALVIIDMQRDFLEPGGFGAALGNDVSLLRAAVGPCKAMLAGARAAGMLVIHTREGHRPICRMLLPPRSCAAIPPSASARRARWGAS